jgi:hypothetical protein
MTPPAGTKPPRRRLRWLAAAALLLALGLGHRALLRGLAGLLVVDESGGEASCVVPFSGYGARARSAEGFAGGAGAPVLLIEGRPSRLEELGVRPTGVEDWRRDLLARGVPSSAVLVVPGSADGDWDRARALRRWLEEHPEARADVLCDRFGSRRLRVILDGVLGPEAGRARVVPLRDRRIDELTWWHSSQGVASCYESLVRLAYVRLAGETSPTRPRWDPDRYEEALRER